MRVAADYMSHYYEHPKMWEISQTIANGVLNAWHAKAMKKEKGRGAYWILGVETASRYVHQLEQTINLDVRPGHDQQKEPYNLAQRGTELFQARQDVGDVIKRQEAEAGVRPSRRVQAPAQHQPGGVPLAAVLAPPTRAAPRPKRRRERTPPPTPRQRTFETKRGKAMLTPGGRARTKQRSRSKS